MANERLQLKCAELGSLTPPRLEPEAEMPVELGLGLLPHGPALSVRLKYLPTVSKAFRLGVSPEMGTLYSQS